MHVRAAFFIGFLSLLGACCCRSYDLSPEQLIEEAGGVAFDGPGLHSHNDYWQAEPLVLALRSGARSIEVDVFRVGDELYVAHDRDEIAYGRTLRAMYLDPLVDAHLTGELGGSSYDNPIILNIDCKSPGTEVWPLLEAQLARYSTGWSNPFRKISPFDWTGVVVDRTPIVVTCKGGAEVLDLMRRADIRYTSWEGHLPGIAKTEEPPHLVFMQSAPLRAVIAEANTDVSPMDPAYFDELRLVIEPWAAKAREEGRVVRIWGTPDTPQMWSMLADAGVQLITTDQPAELSAWLAKRRAFGAETNSTD